MIHWQGADYAQENEYVTTGWKISRVENESDVWVTKLYVGINTLKNGQIKASSKLFHFTFILVTVVPLSVPRDRTTAQRTHTYNKNYE